MEVRVELTKSNLQSGQIKLALEFLNYHRPIGSSVTDARYWAKIVLELAERQYERGE